MKPLFLTIIFLMASSNSFAHGAPTIDEFQMFPESITQSVIANPAGGIVAIPFALVGAVVGLIATPFSGNDFKENAIAGAMFIGLCGYMVGQQVGWPFYGVEKGMEWIF
jgi:hypothetical protein